MFIVRLTCDNDLQRLDFSYEYRKLMYEHYLRFYDFASDLYLRKALRPSLDVL